MCPGGRAINGATIPASKVATSYGLCLQIVYGHRSFSCMGTQRQAGQSRTAEAMRGSYANRAMPMQLLCSLRRFRAEMVRCPCGLLTESAWSRTTFFPNGLLNSCDCHKISARPPHDAHAMLLRFVYGLRNYDSFSNLSLVLTKQTRRGYGARESVRQSYGCRLPPHGGCTIRESRAVYGLRRLTANRM